MKEKHNKINRRNFLKTVGAAGLVPALAGVSVAAASQETKVPPNEPNSKPKSKDKDSEFPHVPKRKLGKTEIEVPVLSHGIMYNSLENQVILSTALKWGVSYWDTAHGYAGGNSELGIGKFLEKNPEIRKDLFIVSKASGAKTIEDVENRLQTSLKRMNTNYVDMYYGVHALSDPAQLTDELKQWAKSAKERKLIRAFGFSTHKNMEKCLMAASKLDWIDGIMTSYNFRLMQKPEMQEAVEACHKAGIGLIAMKIQGLQIETDDDKKLVKHFLEKGFTEGQAKIKVVLEDQRFCAACVTMQNVAILTEDVAAVLDKTKLAQADKDVLAEYARATCSGYCAGCAEICDGALAKDSRVSEVMRYLMYYNSYGDREKARALFAKIPNRYKDRLLTTDYSLAQARCPQHLPIAKLVAEAVRKLA